MIGFKQICKRCPISVMLWHSLKSQTILHFNCLIRNQIRNIYYLINLKLMNLVELLSICVKREHICIYLTTSLYTYNLNVKNSIGVRKTIIKRKWFVNVSLINQLSFYLCIGIQCERVIQTYYYQTFPKKNNYSTFLYVIAIFQFGFVAYTQKYNKINKVSLFFVYEVDTRIYFRYFYFK